MMRDITYTLMDPTQNYTILVETPVPEAFQPETASKLMEKEPCSEQVGFLSKREDCDIVLRMAGGEFCGNATMSTAAFCDMHAKEIKRHVIVAASGVPDPLEVQLNRISESSWWGTVNMPEVSAIETVELCAGHHYPVVRFSGIAHVIVEETMERKRAEQFAREWCAILKQEAVGLMFYDRSAFRLKPLVHVPSAGTMCWESACGSGTSAVGAYLAAKQNHEITVSLKQPGGTLVITAKPFGALKLSGMVKYMHQKTVSIEYETGV